MNFSDLREKCILVGVTAGIFLPFRLLAGQYFAEHWIGNLGFATIVSVLMLYLAKKNKLGRFGKILQNQVRKIVWGKSTRLIIFLLIVFMVYFGTVIILVNQGNTIYRDDKDALFQDIFSKESASSQLRLNGPGISDGEFVGFSQVRYLGYVFSISYAILNDLSGDLLASIHLILFMEQVEMVGLFWLYRKMFRPASMA
jgi:preprotein translocase subunit SecE